MQDLKLEKAAQLPEKSVKNNVNPEQRYQSEENTSQEIKQVPENQGGATGYNSRQSDADSVAENELGNRDSWNQNSTTEYQPHKNGKAEDSTLEVIPSKESNSAPVLLSDVQPVLDAEQTPQGNSLTENEPSPEHKPSPEVNPAPNGMSPPADKLPQDDKPPSVDEHTPREPTDDVPPEDKPPLEDNPTSKAPTNDIHLENKPIPKENCPDVKSLLGVQPPYPFPTDQLGPKVIVSFSIYYVACLSICSTVYI